MLLEGYSPLGAVLQSDLSGLNYFYSLESIDEKNIGCIGHSFGGVRCMYLSALDKRVKATVISSAVGTLKPDYTKGIMHTWLVLVPGIAKYIDGSGLLALIAPRPLIILYTEKDPIFPADEVEKQINPVRELYKRIGNESDFLSVYIPNEVHTFPKKYHEQVYEFMDKNLKA